MQTKMRTTLNSASEQTIELINSEEIVSPSNGKKILAIDRITIRHIKEKNLASILVEKNGVATYFDTTSEKLKGLGTAILKLFEEPKKELPKVKEVKKKGFFK